MSSWDRIRKAASGDWSDTWDRAVDSLGRSGFPDSQMRLDTGHNLWVFHQGHVARPRIDERQPGFHAHVWHGAGDMGHSVEAYLGEDPDHVGPLLRGLFGRRDVMRHLRDQMDRARGVGPDQTGNRLQVNMTQEG